MTKYCPRCKRQVSYEDFTHEAAGINGFGDYCKACCRARNAERRARVGRTRVQLEAERRFRAAHREELRLDARRRWTPEKARLHNLRRNPYKERARHAVNNAIQAGRLRKPKRCEDCGWKGTLHGHHEDYNKPLAVDWLCSICHGRRAPKP